MLYLESPAGVGFSYGPSTKTSDEETSISNLKFMVSFFEQFTDFQTNELFFVGESYAGVINICLLMFTCLDLHSYTC